MISPRQCEKCDEIKTPKDFEVIDGKRSKVCIICTTSESEIPTLDDEQELTEKDFYDDEAED